MRAHYLQHVPFERLGSIELWLANAGYKITVSRLFESPVLPSPDEIDSLIIMGGSMSVNNESKYTWLVHEKKFIRNVISAGKPVLGVCLGAQLIASAMGARVYPNRFKEIGWFPVQGISSDNASLFHFPPWLDVFHWHGETFDLPKGAICLARSKACEHQAFQLGNSVIGLQFHLESTPEAVGELVSNCRNELIPSKYVQSEETILSAKPEKYRVINNLMTEVLSFLQSAKNKRVLTANKHK